MKLQSFAIRQALEEGRHADAIRLVMERFCIDIPHAELIIKTTSDFGYGIRIWIGPQPYEWFDGHFYGHWSNTAKDYSEISVISATVFLR